MSPTMSQSSSVSKLSPRPVAVALTSMNAHLLPVELDVVLPFRRGQN